MAAEIEAVGRGMRGKADKGLWRIRVGELSQDWLAPMPFLAPEWIVEPDARGEIGPAIPCSLFDLVKIIRIIHDVTTPAFIHAVLAGKETTVRIEGYSVRISQSPRDDFEIASIWVATQDGTCTFHITFDHLPWRRFLSEGDIGACVDRIEDVSKYILIG